MVGCEKQQETEQQQEIVCNAPYMRFGTGCCMDANSNSICDNDEKTQAEEVKEEVPAENKTEEKPVKKFAKEVNIDYCYFAGLPTFFECRHAFLWKDGIEMKLRNAQKGMIVLKKIWFSQLDCGMEFPDDEKYKLEFNEDLYLDIPCKIEDDSVDIDMVIDVDYFRPRTDSNGSFKGYMETPNPMKIESGNMGGFVRDRNNDNLEMRDSVSEFVVSSCEFRGQNADFDCTKHNVGPDYVEVRIKAIKNGIYVFKNIELPTVPCEYKFPDTSKEESFKYGEEKIVKISCDFKREYVDSNIELKYDYYAPKRLPGGGLYAKDEYEDTPRDMISTLGYVSGLIE
ncbi:MAG: hypothetical protein V1906_02185 [Candidatus Woesearchaeota archaeon]